MIALGKALKAFGTPSFKEALKREISELKADELPLQQGLSTSSYVSESRVEALIQRVEAVQGTILVKAGIFYSGVIAGCSCADDPTPMDENTEYCEVRIEIDRATGMATITLWGDSDER